MNLIHKTIDPYRGLPKEIYILFVTRIINSMGAFVFPLLSLILTQRIGFTKVQAGTFVTFLAISQVPGMLIGGKLVDSFGRKKIIIIFQVLGALCYIICGLLRPSMLMAIVIVLAFGVYSMAGPAIDAVAADLTKPSNRKGAYSLLYMGHNLGFAVAPVVGGLLYKNHLPILFIGDGGTTLLSLVLFTIFVKETIQGKSEMDDNSNKLEAHEEGSVFSVLMKRPIVLYFALIMFIYQFVYAQWGFTLPLQMGDVFGSDGARLYGLVAGMNGIIVILCTPIVTLIINKVKSMRAIAFGGLLYAIAFGMLGFVTHLSFYFLFIFILTIGEIVITVNSNTFVANHTPASHRGRINSIVPIITGSGFAIGPMVMGSVMESYGHRTTWCIVSAFVLFGAICMILLEGVEKKAQMRDISLE